MAVGVVAMGQQATGVVAIGQIATGFIVVGQASTGRIRCAASLMILLMVDRQRRISRAIRVGVWPWSKCSSGLTSRVMQQQLGVDCPQSSCSVDPGSRSTIATT
ncbi:hypothetical protein [Nocardia sp. NPDC059228]|uniref:hypothetical protein n=1 Tax=Nocardia sp. NPDC059228 TaxID=3346777 RepID=UPI003689134F